MGNGVRFDLDVQPAFGRIKGSVMLPDRPMRLSELAWNAMQLDEQLIAMAVRRDTRDGTHSISCTKGCGACCRQLVPLSPPEAFMIADVVASYPPTRRAEVLSRMQHIRETLDARDFGKREVAVGSKQDLHDAIFSMSADYFELGLPCPFLEEESCSIHVDRPAICREFLATTPAPLCGDLRKKAVRAVPVAAHLTDCLSKLSAELLGGPQHLVPLFEAVPWAAEHAEEGLRTWDASMLMQRLVELINASKQPR